MKNQITNSEAKEKVSVKLVFNTGKIYDGTIEKMGKIKGVFCGSPCHSDGIVIAPAKPKRFSFNVADVNFFSN